MKGWHAVLAALLFLLPQRARAAEDATGAARELARKTAALAGKSDAVSVTWRNVSALGPAEWNQARSAFEGALRETGARLQDTAAVEARITLSENRAQYLLVEEVRKGEERQVWIAGWKRAAPSTNAAPAVTLEKKLVWEQEEPILDVAFPGGGMLLLTASKLTLFTRENNQWTAKQSVALPAGRAWPRDLRGRLRVNGAALQAYLPGVMCAGTVDAAAGSGLSATCRTSEEAWVLESGNRSLLLGWFAGGRNFFDGRVTSQTGQRKVLAPFYSAAAVEDQGRTQWLLAMTDGSVQLLDAGMESLGPLNVAWGSDLVGTSARCGSGSQVLASRPADGATADAVQAYSVVDRVPVPLTLPAEMSGPVTALWPSGGSAAIAIVRNPGSGRYEAYALTISCS